MKYISTRDTEKKQYTSAQVIKMGLAPDGGLFVPDSIPALDMTIVEELCSLSYNERAAKVLSMFLTDYTYDELFAYSSAAYSDASFPGGAAPLVDIGNSMYSLELWHGPTSAFKDMALQIMPRLLSGALKKTGEERTALILVATSGDTGKAALEGYRDIDGIKIMVFYPSDGVSRVQKLQMATQIGKNVNVCAINGNFDDAQNGVKKIFANVDATQKLNDNGYFFSSANSINWGRLVPQIVYYISAYCDLINNGTIKAGDSINVTVPTGNFGNIFAAYLSKLMGLPINKLVCASNSNNVLTDFIRTGTYDRNRDFFCTISPSMDILISSNLERLIYMCAGTEKTREYMSSLANTGKYVVDAEIMSKISETFVGYYADEENTSFTIKKHFENGYLCDTHTAVALYAAEKYMNDSKESTPMVIASTASAYKFASDVLKSITGKSPADELRALSELSALSGTEISHPLRDIDKREVRFSGSVPAGAMLAEVYRYLEI